MKKIFFIMVLLSLIILSGCSRYKLPKEGAFCYYGDSIVELDEEGKEYIIDLLNSSKWIKGLTDDDSDYTFYTKRQTIKYTSSLGIFNDYTNKRHLIISKDDSIVIRQILTEHCGLEPTHSYSFNSYEELSSFLSYENLQHEYAEANALSNVGGSYYTKFINTMINGGSYLIPTNNGDNCELVDYSGWKISLLTTELYDRSWLWYSVSIDGIDMQIRVMLNELERMDDITSPSRIVKRISFKSPNVYNKDKYSNYKDIYEKDMMIGNTKTTTMIYDHEKALYVLYRYDNYLIMLRVTNEQGKQKVLNNDILRDLSFKKITTDSN